MPTWWVFQIVHIGPVFHEVIIFSSNEFEIMRSDLAFKEGELEKSKFTEEGLKSENLNLQANLQKVLHLCTCFTFIC